MHVASERYLWLATCKYGLESTSDFPLNGCEPQRIDDVSCVQGLRIPVATVVHRVADVRTEAELLKAYLELERKTIREALRYAA